MKNYATLVCYALDQLWVQGEDDGCCPQCCAPCSVLKELQDSGLLNALVRQAPEHLWLNAAWWINLMVDPEWLSAAWRMTSCHEPMSGRSDPEELPDSADPGVLAAVDAFLDDPVTGRVRMRPPEGG